jgi:hypothetical protein
MTLEELRKSLGLTLEDVERIENRPGRKEHQALMARIENGTASPEELAKFEEDTAICDFIGETGTILPDDITEREIQLILEDWRAQKKAAADHPDGLPHDMPARRVDESGEDQHLRTRGFVRFRFEK